MNLTTYEGFPWMKTVLMEIGQSEINGQANKYFRDIWPKSTYDVRNTAWCAAFACWCLNVWVDEKPKFLAAREFLKFGDKVVSGTPYGSIVVFSRKGTQLWQGHVGFCVSRNNSGSVVEVVGGNQDGRVQQSQYLRSRIVGVRWPRVSDRFQLMP
jgi:uncharacterized protein (TIGR02594 family)